MSDFETIVLWRPVGPVELELIKQLKMRAFPPRLPGQPIFYPVLSEQYAHQDRKGLECSSVWKGIRNPISRAQGFLGQL